MNVILPYRRAGEPEIHGSERPSREGISPPGMTPIGAAPSLPAYKDKEQRDQAKCLALAATH